ncbi:glycosyltransferase family 4 protein [Hyphomicrobium sulfonivorans]|uniref:glycosyltransferase family 4 protein n=1 Tax=Hyphomicrobium sulfonivorans TaxID=121290 RepID=UPI00156DADC9|nr:glycosyltransferase [Hyphomicrobium sulfonivorans]MBI1649587.1 glycosyltransferase [Hyphomicrobium sulfonivorans]NSL71503.1 hypothetical protein [Hyphomicrobium sulfonivorans]
MKIVMVGPYPEPGKQVSGGVERVIDTLLPELGRQVDLTLIVPGAQRDAETVNHGVRTIYLKRGPGPGAARYWTFDARRVARAVESIRPDLVHLQGLAGLGRLISLPRILTVHGIAHRDLLLTSRGDRWGPLARHGMAHVMRTVEARARRQIGNVIVINPYVHEAFPDIVNGHHFAIPNPLDAAFMEPLRNETQPREPHIISIGHISPHKNTLGILRIVAAAMQANTSARMSIYGSSANAEYSQACRDFIRQERLDDRIAFAGNVASNELARALDQSCCLIMASPQENAPMTIAEAHARGVAVVAPEAFGIKYMIAPGRNGFFLPARDLHAQAAVLQRALDHDWRRAAIAHDAWQTYAPGLIAEKTIAAYRAVLTGDAPIATPQGLAPRHKRDLERSAHGPV